MKKIFLALSFLGLLSGLFPAQKSEARITDRGLAITGVALGGSALALGGLNTWALSRRGGFGNGFGNYYGTGFGNGFGNYYGTVFG